MSGHSMSSSTRMLFACSGVLVLVPLGVAGYWRYLGFRERELRSRVFMDPAVPTLFVVAVVSGFCAGRVEAGWWWLLIVQAAFVIPAAMWGTRRLRHLRDAP